MVGAQNYIQVHKITALLDDETPDYSKIFEDIISHGYTPVLVEQGGTKIRDYIWPENPCIVLGNESTGFPVEIVSQWDTVTIPQRGVIRSLNVSTAAGIVMEHLSYSLS
jgi:tRNA G18 (ribose-2'-O)-methylase SpoU